MTEHDLIDAPPHQVAGDSALQSQTLESVASAYNYHAWLRHLAMPYLGSHPLELGSGLGDYAQAYLDATSTRAFPASVVSEADPVRLGMLRRRFESQPRVAGRLLRVRDRLVIPAARRAESGGRRHLGSPCWPSAACGPNPSI